MFSTNDIKMNIINLLTRINDPKKLNFIYKKIEKVNTEEDSASTSQNITNLKDAFVEVRSGVSLEQILDEQNYIPMTRNEFDKLTAPIKWDRSLEKLLIALD